MIHDWVLIYTTFKVYKMRIIRGILDGEGVDNASINKRETISNMQGEVELYVHKEDVEKAKKIINETSFEQHEEE